MHFLVATDADHVANDVISALASPDHRFSVCTEGRDISDLVAKGDVDLAILDLQIGSKGGMAVAMDLRLDHSSGRIPDVRVLMLLDRKADVFLAQRSAADAWLVKPFDPLSLKRAVKAAITPPTPDALEADAVEAPEAESPEEDAVAAG